MAEWFHKQRIGDLPREAARLHGAREAMVFADRRWTYAQFAAEVDRTAKGLIAAGVQPGEKVALWMVNRPEWLFLMYAVPLVGAVLVPLNTRYRSADMAYTVQQSNTVTLITHARSGPVDYLGLLQAAMPDLPRQAARALTLAAFPDLKRIVLTDRENAPGTLGWQAVMAAGDALSDRALAERADAVDPDVTCLIAYTSGTTGHPKGVLHNHSVVRAGIDRMNRLGLTFDDVTMTYLPLFHLYGFSEAALHVLLTNGKLVLMEAFEARECVRLIEREKATVLHGFDTHFRDIMLAQESERRDLSSLRMGTFPSGMASSIPIAYATQKTLCPTVSGWGMTESWAFATCSFTNSSEEQRVEASGFAMPGYEFRIVDPTTGRDLPAGEPGELLCRGYTVTRGYYNKPKETAEAIDAEGWLHTGDTCVMRADGHVRFLGRYKDILKVGGENVSAAEVEAFIMALPAVAEVAVVSYPDPRLVQVPVAFVRIRPNHRLLASDVVEHCRDQIASFKVPRHVLFIDELPMTASGKVQKHKLRDLALEQLGPPERKTA
ncbi:MAG: AMP-binding protein [Alphaproteobacteria bacterium]|nr:AMP-binding protein [Alphaproteobacteria bacterium]